MNGVNPRAEQQRLRRQLLKAKGLCHWCMKPTDGKVGCPECRERNSNKAKLWHKNNYETVMNHYGKICVCCGESDERFLSIDHINNDGYKKRQTREDCTGPSWYSRIIKRGFPDDLQVLCFNCNLGKNRCGGICPHKVMKGQEVALSRT
jgi:hypothetical protein